jgi:hypothetical protein
MAAASKIPGAESAGFLAGNGFCSTHRSNSCLARYEPVIVSVRPFLLLNLADNVNTPPQCYDRFFTMNSSFPAAPRTRKEKHIDVSLEMFWQKPDDSALARNHSSNQIGRG